MRLSHIAVCFSMALGFAALAACGAATPEPVAPTGPEAAAPATAASSAALVPTSAPTAAPLATAPAAPATVAFSAMNNEQKIAHMKAVITPKMGKVFQEGDAKRYADFGCKTCHGEKKQDPHMVLPRLTLSGDGFQKLMAAKPAVMKFMSEKVTPEMAAAMGEKPFDPATKKGFGCGGCHAVN
ncbi:Hypothetical protein A7982_03819 [Minicystis rosea]|nr:Hypothetical protein A7982_03819 [Minicystis rosea]